MSTGHSGQLVAARHRDGLVVKGRTTDFLPTRDHFHVVVDEDPDPVRVEVADLKALFFIRTPDGTPEHQEAKAFQHSSGTWVKLWIVFDCDGEELAGWTASSLFRKTGFFMIPTDQGSNIIKLFVFRHSLRKLLRGTEAENAARDYARRKAVHEPVRRSADDASAKPESARRETAPDKLDWDDRQKITNSAIEKLLRP